MISYTHIIRPIYKNVSRIKKSEKNEQQKTIEVHPAAETEIVGRCSDNMTGGA